MDELVKDYFDSSKDIFLYPTTSGILEHVKTNANLTHITTQDVIQFRQTLYEISRATEARLLRGKKRYLANRPWLTFAPGTAPYFFVFLYLTLLEHDLPWIISHMF